MKCLSILAGVMAATVVAMATLEHHGVHEMHGYCDRESHNKTVFLDAFRDDVYINVSDVAYIHHMECERCQGCVEEKYYGAKDGVLWAKEPCNGTFLVYYTKDQRQRVKTVRLDASHHDVSTPWSGSRVDFIQCHHCQGCQGSFGSKDIHYRDASGTKVTKKQIWAKSPCQGTFKIDYLKAHCTNITMKGDAVTVHARHISEPCENGNIFRMEMLPGTATGDCEFGRDVYFHKDIIFYGNCAATFEVCQVAPYDKMDHSAHVMSDTDTRIKEYWTRKVQHKYKMRNTRHHHDSHSRR